MNSAQGAVITMVGFGTTVNLIDSVKRSRPYELPIVGGFIIATILLTVATSARAGRIAEMLALAFLITSLSNNGAPLFTAISSATGTSRAARGNVRKPI